jgi:cysteinyl-tRNA synthetase
MSMKYLGSQFDIHTGGIDHREIHHCNEIAQNQAFTGTPKSGANFWMHNNFLVDRGGKMSKSKGGFATLASVIDKGVHPLAYRLLCLSAHYRSELEFSPEALAAALTRLQRLVIAAEQLREKAAAPEWLRLVGEASASKGSSFAYQRSVIEAGLDARANELLAQFDIALSGDLMVPQALPLLEQALADKALPPDQKLRLIASMDMALGLDLLRISRIDLRIRPADAAIEDAEIEVRLEARQQARAAKDYAASDSIREELAGRGVAVMDGAGAMRWDWILDI